MKGQERRGQSEINQRCLIIRLNEELDHHNAIEIRKKADRMIERNYIKNIIFDFSGAEFMDSAGMELLWADIKGDFYWWQYCSCQC